VICERDLQKVLKWNEEKELSYEIKDYVEFLKWNELKVLPYETKNYFVLHDVIMWMK